MKTILSRHFAPISATLLLGLASTCVYTSATPPSELSEAQLSEIVGGQTGTETKCRLLAACAGVSTNCFDLTPGAAENMPCSQPSVTKFAKPGVCDKTGKILGCTVDQTVLVNCFYTNTCVTKKNVDTGNLYCADTGLKGTPTCTEAMYGIAKNDINCPAEVCTPP